MIDKKKLISELEQIADLMEFKGENSFKVGAFRNGAFTIRRIEEDINQLIENNHLSKVKGIGKALFEVVNDFYVHGESKLLKELKSELPSTLLELFNVRGIGPKKIKQLYTELDIDSIPKLESACLNDKVAGLKGFGKGTQDKILNSLLEMKKAAGFILLDEADLIIEKISSLLNKNKSVFRWEICGEHRRKCEVVSSLIFLVECIDKIIFDNDELDFDYQDDSILIKNFKIEVRIYFSSKNEFISKLIELTGDDAFLNSINFKNNFINADSEEDYFNQIKIKFIPPEFRESLFIEKSLLPKLKKSNLSEKDFQGFLHFHTIYSDGINKLEDMIKSALDFGYKYFAVCDHSKSAFYANGLAEDRIEKQHDEIKTISKKLNVKIFKGIESDILTDGSLDYDKSILKKFDFIVASIHSRFNLSKDEMTQRVIKAVENPYTDVLAHPTGRLLLARSAYEIDLFKVIDACIQNDVAIEINSNPKRLDLDWRMLYYAREKGVKFSINQDAHSIEQINYLKYGVMIAQKGGVQPNEVINCYDEKSFIKFLNRKNIRKV